MNLKEVFDQLTYGELSQLAIGGGELGAITPANYARVVSHLNLGLTALYKRFLLKEGELTVELVADRTEYPITIKYAESNRASRELVKFIKDTGNPFKGDLHKIERVYVDSGYELSINDLMDQWGLWMPTMTTLKVPLTVVNQDPDLPDELKTEKLRVVYRANHPSIDPEDLEPEDVELELPDSHLQPLLLFVASRAHMPAGMQGEFNAGNNYFQQYELACKQLEDMGYQLSQQAQVDKITRGGWK